MPTDAGSVEAVQTGAVASGRNPRQRSQPPRHASHSQERAFNSNDPTPRRRGRRTAQAYATAVPRSGAQQRSYAQAPRAGGQQRLTLRRRGRRTAPRHAGEQPRPAHSSDLMPRAPRAARRNERSYAQAPGRRTATGLCSAATTTTITADSRPRAILWLRQQLWLSWRRRTPAYVTAGVWICAPPCRCGTAIAVYYSRPCSFRPR
jgi:hypothetical protein